MANPNLSTLLKESADRHGGHLCPRQVLGVRMGIYAGELHEIELPQADKRLFALVETDGCLTDGIGVAAGCWMGRRTMRLVDYGKIAATFIDTHTGRAIRISPSRTARERSAFYAPGAADTWHAQLEAYQIMPAEELFEAREVELTISLDDIISKPGRRVVCEVCGEEIINERWVRKGEAYLCRPCAGGAYYTGAGLPLPLEMMQSTCACTCNID